MSNFVDSQTMEKSPIQFKFTADDDFVEIANLNAAARHVLSEVQSCRKLFDELCEAGFVFERDENNLQTMLFHPAGLRMPTLLMSAGTPKWNSLPTENIHAEAAKIISNPLRYLNPESTTDPEDLARWAGEELKLRTAVQQDEEVILQGIPAEIRKGVSCLVGNETLHLEHSRKEPRVGVIVCHILRALIQSNHMNFYQIMRLTR